MSDWIVVATDGSEPASAAVAWAADEAALWGRRLCLVHVTGPRGLAAPYAELEGLAEAVSEESAAVLRDAELAARDRAPDLDVVTRHYAGAVVPALLEEAKGASEIVVGSRGRGGLTGLLLGSVSLGVTANATCPVIVVREAPAPRGEARGEILLGFDVSPHAEISFAYAADQARRRGARLRALHAWQPQVSPGVLTHYPDLTEAAMEAETATVRRSLSRWRERYPDVEIIETLVSGHPVTALSAAAPEADLVVVGSRGRGGVARALLGSVGHAVLHNVSRPVAVVH